MSALALVGGVFLYRVLHAYLRVGPTLRCRAACGATVCSERRWMCRPGG